MADIPLQALSQNLSATQGFPVRVKFIPKNIDGTIHDCTAATAVGLNLAQNLAAVNFSESMNADTVTGDATGVVCTFNKATIATLIATTIPLNGVYTATLVEGANSGNLAAGSYSIGLIL